MRIMREVRQVLLQYNVDAIHVKRTSRGVSNNSFFVYTKSGEFVLRIYDTQSTKSAVRFEVALLEKLHAAGMIPTPEILPNLRERLVTTVSMGGKQRYAILMRKLSGRIVVPTDYSLISAVAKTHAQLHVVSARLIRPRQSVQKTLDHGRFWFTKEMSRVEEQFTSYGLWDAYRTQALDLQTALRQISRVIVRLPSAECHLDYDSDNILTNGKRITGVIDFGDVVHAPLVMDLGYSLWWWLFCNPVKKHQAILKSYLSAYQKVRPLLQKEKELLKVFIQLRNLGLAAYFYGYGHRTGKTYLLKTLRLGHVINTLLVV